MKGIRPRRLPSPALVVALLALLVALGGTAYAVQKAPKNSVVSKSVKNDSLTGSDIREDTLALPKGDQYPTTLPPSGPAGGALTGAYPNPRIAANAIGGAELDLEKQLVRHDSATDSSNSKAVEVACPDGSVSVGVGYLVTGAGANFVDVQALLPLDEASGWAGFAVEVTPTALNWRLQVIVDCLEV